MKSSREHMEIVNAYALVGSYRGAAALCGTNHKTVERLVSRRDGAERQPRDMVRNTAVVEGLIADRVRASDGRISAKRLLPIVAAAGYTGSARNLRRAVAAAKATWKRQRRTYLPWVPVPGEHLVIDWATEAGRRSSARSVRGAAIASCASPLIRRDKPRWRCWRSASPNWAAYRRSC